MAEPHAPEVLVLGGGPAGCTVAALLAAWGHGVALLTRDEPQASALAQSVPPSARKLLSEIGALDALEAGGLHPNGGNTVWWAERPVRGERFGQGEHGWHADRSGLEAVFQGWAEAAGARIERAHAHAVERTDDGWRVSRGAVDPPGSGDARTSAWLVDATGRTGLVARRDLRRPDHDTPTLALVHRWRRSDGWAGAPATHTLIESYEDGWAWSVPVSEGERCVTAMVDPEVTDLRDPGGLNAAYAAELGKCAELSALLEGAVPLGDAWACPASLYTARAFTGPGLVLAGDAGSFIDPLSSYGVKKALASGWLAAVALHTALIDPPMAEAALELHDANEHEVYRTYRSRSVPFFQEAASTYGHPYWARRAEAAREASEGVSGAQDPAERRPGAAVQLPSEAAVREAYDGIRAAEHLRAATTAGTRTVPRPGVEGNRIVAVDHLATDRVPGGVRWVRNVDLVALADEAPRHTQVPELFQAYCARAAPVPLTDFLAALATAFAAGILEHADG